VAADTSARPLYTEFLARVIKIEAVQCYRMAVTDEHTREFFAAGRRPGVFGDFYWSLDAPEASPWGPLAPGTSEEPVPSSLPMQHAWDAAVTAWRAFITLIVNCELIASGVYPATGVRCDLDPAEWTRSGSILDVRNGDLLEVRQGKREVRWASITLRAAGPVEGSKPARATKPPVAAEPLGVAEPVQAKPAQAAVPQTPSARKPGRIDWDDWWKHETDRREKGSLPNKRDYFRQARLVIMERYGVTPVPESELRRLQAALYRGDKERPKRRRKHPPGKPNPSEG
jgi:hypothetical protein